MTAVKNFLLFVILFSFGMTGYIQADANVAGTVSDQSTGLPIQGATIELIRGGQVRASDTTNVNGQYLIINVQPGNYDVVVSAPGYQTQIIGAKLDNNTTTTIDFSLVPNGGAISGTVTDANTTSPIAGATIGLFLGNAFITSTTTDGSGNYSFPNLAPDDNYNVVAIASGYGAQVKSATVTAGNTTIVNFELIASQGTIAGIVTDAVTTNPIEGATVTVFLDGLRTITSVDTDASGNYSISGLAPGNYTVVAEAPGYQIASTPAVVVANLTTIVNFALISNPGTITGVVTDLCTGFGIPGVLITVFDGSSVVTFGITDQNGQYFINDLAPGSYTLIVTKQNYVPTSSVAIVIADNTTTVNFVLTPTALPPSSIFGRAFFNKFLTQKQRAHCIQWTPSPSGCIVEYQVFRNGILVATVLPSQPLAFCDLNRNVTNSDTYSVRAINAFGQISDFVTIILN